MIPQETHCNRGIATQAGKSQFLQESCPVRLGTEKVFLVDVSVFFFFFLPFGERERGVRGAGERGVGLLLKIPAGGGVLQEGPRGRDGVCGESGTFFWGGGAKFFFFGAETSTKSSISKESPQDIPRNF